MKKTLILISSLFICTGLFAQVLPSVGVNNTISSTLGKPIGTDSFKFNGLQDTIEVCAKVSNFSIDGMLSWGIFTAWKSDDKLDYFRFLNSAATPIYFLYSGAAAEDPASTPSGLFETAGGNTLSPALIALKYDNSIRLNNFYQNPYHVNVIWNPIPSLDLGIGTDLNWSVGKAPDNGDKIWGPYAHIKQGGFSTSFDERTNSAYSDYKFTYDVPGSADVVGFVHYANVYAKNAIGARFFYDKKLKFQAGAAIPNFADTDSPVLNVGFEIGFENFTISTAYEGLFQKDGNFFAGTTFGIKQFMVDAFFACNSIDTDNSSSDIKDISFSVGGAVNMSFGKKGVFKLRPEGALNWFENTDYTPAWYVGTEFEWNIADNMMLSAFSSFAIGSMDKTWKDNSLTKDFHGGVIIDVRPAFTFVFTKNHSITGFIDWQARTAFDGKTRTGWLSGAYWTYRINAGKK